MSNPQWFEKDPSFAWGFFGHRYNLYSSTEPHEGFKMLLNWAKEKELGYFVFTSNVDGHFQKAGFDPDAVAECHGSINFMQMADTTLSEQIWPVAKGTVYDVDMDTLRLRGDLPQGPPDSPRALARPNILMFGDWGWQPDRTHEQMQRYQEFRRRLGTECSKRHNDGNKPDVVVIEIGAGLAVPTVRYEGEDLTAKRQHYKAMLIRINPNEAQIPDKAKDISLSIGGLPALKEIEKYL